MKPFCGNIDAHCDARAQCNWPKDIHSLPSQFRSKAYHDNDKVLAKYVT